MTHLLDYGSLLHLKSSAGRFSRQGDLLFFRTLTVLQMFSNKMSFQVIFSSSFAWQVSVLKLSNILGSRLLSILLKCPICLVFCCSSISNVISDFSLSGTDLVFCSAVSCLTILHIVLVSLCVAANSA